MRILKKTFYFFLTLLFVLALIINIPQNANVSAEALSYIDNSYVGNSLFSKDGKNISSFDDFDIGDTFTAIIVTNALDNSSSGGKLVFADDRSSTYGTSCPISYGTLLRSEYDAKRTDRYLWRFKCVEKKNGHNVFTICNLHTNNYFLDANTTSSNGTVTHLWNDGNNSATTTSASSHYNRKWLVKGGITAGGKTLSINTNIYHIGSNGEVSNFVLSVENVSKSSGRITTWSSNGSAGQVFHILPIVHTERVADTYGSAPHNFTSTFSALSSGLNLSVGEKQASGFILSMLSAPSTNTEKCLFEFQGWNGDNNALCWSINHKATKISMDLRGGLNGNNVQVGFYDSHGNNGSPQRWFMLYPMDGSGGFYLSSLCYASDMKITIGKFDSATNEIKVSSTFAEGKNNLFYFTPKSPVVTYTDTIDTEPQTVLGSNSVAQTVYHNVAYEIKNSLYDGYSLSKGDNIVIAGRDKDNNYNSKINIQRQFQKNTYTITFIPNGGVGASFSKSYTCFEGELLPKNTFSNTANIKYINEGKTVSRSFKLNFKGWNTKADGSGRAFENEEYINNITLTDGENINLYAQWEMQKVYFPLVSKNGYEFLGWSKDSYLSQASILENTFHYVSSNEKFYACWYTIVQNWNESSNETLNIETKVLCNGSLQTDINVLYTVNQIAKNTSKQLLTSSNSSLSYEFEKAGAGNALECKALLTVGNVSKEKVFVSSLFVGDVLVDKNAYYTRENKDYCGTYNSFPIPMYSHIEAGNTAEYIYATNDIISGIHFGESLKNATFDYKLYGVWGENKILLMSNLVENRNGTLCPTDTVSMEGASFDYLVLSITNKGKNSIDLSKKDILLLKLPRIYKFDLSKEGFKTFYLTSKGNASVSPRTVYKNESYFYEDDLIRIAFPVENGFKISAGSHILFNGIKVYPTFSIPENGYVYFDYINYYEYLTGRDKQLNNIKISMADSVVKPVMKIISSDNSDTNGFNFAPLGVKYNEKLKAIRFGTLLYLEDAYIDLNINKSFVGSYVIDINKIFSKSDATNDFYVYLTGIEGGNDIINKCKEYISAENLSSEGKNYILHYISQFIKWYNSKEGNKAMSFGIPTVDSAYSFYHITDEKGNIFIEFSSALSIDETNKKSNYLYIPYIENENTFVYAIPENIYSYSNFDSSEEKPTITLSQKEVESDFKIVYSNGDSYYRDVSSIIQNAFMAEVGASPSLLLDTSGSCNYEIILNSQNRTDCKNLINTLGDSEYAIKTIKTESKTLIILAYKNYASAMKCVEHFVEEYIEGDGQIISIPADINVKGSCTSAEISSEILIGTGVYNLRDPSMFYENGVYYMYGTGWGCYTATNIKGPWTYRGEVAKAPSDIYYDGAPLPSGVTRPSWAQKWAPEVFKHNGKYYMFTTYFSIKTYHRGCVIMVSDSPLGPFVPTTDGHITRSDWDCIDGTLYIDEGGQPWMMFVHEWTCQPDGIGTFAVARLSEDFTHFISEPIELFKANSVSWDASCVTDGCYVKKCQDGSLLMIWSNFCGSDYVVAVAKSPSGNICGPWIHQEKMLYSKNEIVKNDGGHGMFFEAENGQLYMILHSPNTSTTSNPTQSVVVRVEEKYGLIYWDFYKKK